MLTRKKMGFFDTLSTWRNKKKGKLEVFFRPPDVLYICTTEDPNYTKKELMIMADKLDKIERALHIQPSRNLKGSGNAMKEDDQKLMRHPTVDMSSDPETNKSADPAPKKSKAVVKFEEPKKQRDEMKNPYWMEDNEENRKKCQLLLDAKRKDIKPTEIKFWVDMIKEYLLPLDENKEEKKKISEGLKELKNGVSLSFMLLNVMWVTAIYMLQAKKDVLGLK